MMMEKNSDRERPVEELDRRLISVARVILETEGLEALTLRAAARAAGVSHMAPYRHYASKDELLAAVAEEGFRDLARALDDATATGHATTHLENISVAYLGFAVRNPALYRLMFGAHLPNRGRFSALVDAGNEAFQRFVQAIDPEAKPHAAAGPASSVASRKAVAAWALAHGLASLNIDGLISLSGPDDPGHARDVIALLDAR
jgi:AcrR family transcriptional regulator